MHTHLLTYTRVCIGTHTHAHTYTHTHTLHISGAQKEDTNNQKEEAEKNLRKMQREVCGMFGFKRSDVGGQGRHGGGEAEDQAFAQKWGREGVVYVMKVDSKRCGERRHDGGVAVAVGRGPVLSYDRPGEGGQVEYQERYLVLEKGSLMLFKKSVHFADGCQPLVSWQRGLGCLGRRGKKEGGIEKTLCQQQSAIVTRTMHARFLLFLLLLLLLLLLRF